MGVVDNPEEAAGVTTVTLVAVRDVTAALTFPNFTAVTEPKLLPVTTTVDPPATEPEFGEIDVMVGAREMKVNADKRVAVPPGPVTEIGTTPAAFAGEVTTNEVEDCETIEAADTPKATDVTALKFDPEIVTVVPPAVEPVIGVTPEMVGAGGTYVNDEDFVAAPLLFVTTTSTVPADPAGVMATIEVDVRDEIIPVDVPNFTLVTD